MPAVEQEFRRLQVGDRVMPGGPDWLWDQQGRTPDGAPLIGEVREVYNDCITVEWPDAGQSVRRASYRHSSDHQDLILVGAQEPATPTTPPTRPETLVSGTRVTRGPHWHYSYEQDDGPGSEGTVTGPLDHHLGWVRVMWDSGKSYGYRWGAEGCYDLEIVNTEPDARSLKERFLEFLKSFRSRC
jgi:hypothetical protein